MRYGFSQHLIIGRIGHMEIGTQAGTKTVRVTLAAKLFPPRRSDGPDVTWYDMTVWGRSAESFTRMNFRPGDQLGMRTPSLEAHLWKDRSGEFHASLRGNADNFWDLRPSPRPAGGPSARSRNRGFESPDCPYPSDAEMAAGERMLQDRNNGKGFRDIDLRKEGEGVSPAPGNVEGRGSGCPVRFRAPDDGREQEDGQSPSPSAGPRMR
jgi:single-stranded DNA-binding protein